MLTRSPITRRRLLGAAAVAPLALSALPALAAPRRVVCAGGAITECVFALGHGGEVVAVDTTSLYPAAVQPLPKIGYFRQLSMEGLLSLAPDLVIADVDAGPANVLKQLGETTQILHQFKGPVAASTIPDKVRFVAAALGENVRGEEVATTIAADLGALKTAVARVDRKPRTIFMLGTTKGRMAGSGTAAQLAIDLAGGENLGADFTGYRPLSTEGILGLRPDFILTMFASAQMPPEGTDLAAQATRELGLADLPEASRPKVIVIDPAYLLAMGPRSAHACYDLAAQLHPELDWPGLPARSWVG